MRTQPLECQIERVTAVIHGNAWPTPAELYVTGATYLKGLSEAATEMRRFVLDLMRRNQVSGLAVGALVGLAQDSLSKVPLGMYGIVKTLVGYFAASVGMRLDVDHNFIRLLLSFVFFLFHQILFWVMERALLSHQPAFEIQRWLVLGLLNAVIGAAWLGLKVLPATF